MKHRLFNLAAGLSLVLYVATVVLWVRSYFCWDSLHCNSPVLSDVSQLKITTESVLGNVTLNYTLTTDLGGWIETGSTYAKPGLNCTSQAVRNHTN